MSYFHICYRLLLVFVDEGDNKLAEFFFIIHDYFKIVQELVTFLIRKLRIRAVRLIANGRIET